MVFEICKKVSYVLKGIRIYKNISTADDRQGSGTSQEL